MVWLILIIIVVCAVIGLFELRSWRKPGERAGDAWQKGGHGPWPSGGTDRSTQPGKD